ncbi:MAG: GNAT family N-acetyltransferase [Ktedonobacterales bacterium]
MSQNKPVLTDEQRALQTLDVHYAMALGCSAADLRRPAWTLVTARDDRDPMALLFGRRTLLSLIVPRRSTPGADQGGVALVAPELRAPLAGLLRDLPACDAITLDGRRALDRIVTHGVPEHGTPMREAHLRVRYARPGVFLPYVGSWLEFIEPLDEATELEAGALSLLAHYSSGVWVVRSGDSIVSFAGIRAASPHVAEIHVRTDSEAHRGHGLANAVVSRATRAVLASGRVPLFRHRASQLASERLADTLGYRLYADIIEYSAPAR